MCKKKQERMSLWTRISYGMGNFGGNTGMMLITSYFMYFCTDSLKLSAGIIGVLLMISKVLDGISDIVVGYIVNNTKTKYGKARFWLIVSAVPHGIAVALLFYVPAIIPGDLTYAYLFVIYLLYSAVFYTMFSISSNSLNALATKNAEDRYSMAMFFQAFGGIPVLIIGFAAIPLVELLGGGRQGWALAALLCGIISAATILWAGLAVKELPERPEDAKDNAERTSLLAASKYLGKNKYFWFLLIINLAIYIYYGMQGTATVYFCSHVLENEAAFGWINMAIYGPLVFLIYFAPPVVKKLGARRANVAGAAVAVIGGLLAFVNPRSLGWVLASCLLGNIGLLPQYVTMNPLVAEAAEYTKRRHGKDLTAIFYSCVSVGSKVGHGVGTALTGLILDRAGYDGALAVQPRAAVNAIMLVFLAAPVVGYAVQGFFFSKLDVDELNRRAAEGL